jgi:hypothetical protein
MMHHTLQNKLQQIFLCLALFSSYLHAASAQEKYVLNFPPSAELNYAIKANIRGLILDGTGLIRWTGAHDKYRLLFETRAALAGTLLSESSEGTIDHFGFAPDVFSIKRFRKEAVAVVFDRTARQVNFGGDVPPYVLQGGEQDRLSVLWQLLSVARAAPTHIKPGSTWRFIVLGQHDSETWIFQVREAQRIRTPLGEYNVQHIVRMLPENSGSQQMDIWLAPALEWFPVKLRISEENGDYIEQSIESLNKK